MLVKIMAVELYSGATPGHRTRGRRAVLAAREHAWPAPEAKQGRALPPSPVKTHEGINDVTNGTAIGACGRACICICRPARPASDATFPEQPQQQEKHA